MTYQPREFTTARKRGKAARPKSFTPRRRASDREPVISIVVPVKDEEDGVAPFVERVAPILEGISGGEWEILFVCDVCTDGTPERLTELTRTEAPGEQVLRYTPNRGKG